MQFTPVSVVDCTLSFGFELQDMELKGEVMLTVLSALPNSSSHNHDTTTSAIPQFQFLLTKVVRDICIFSIYIHHQMLVKNTVKLFSAIFFKEA